MIKSYRRKVKLASDFKKFEKTLRKKIANFYCFFPHIVLWWKSLRSLLVRSKLWNSSFCNEHLRLKRAWLTNGEFKWQLHYFKGAFTNYVDKILPIIDHLSWYYWWNYFTVKGENLHTVDIFSTTYTYLHSLVNLVFERPLTFLSGSLPKLVFLYESI